MTHDELQRIAERTLAHYDQRAQAFLEGTRDHDVRQNIDALLQAIEAAPPFELLDLGCGPGRDLAAFTALGHRATGIEGSPRLAAMAREHSGCTVLEQNLLSLKLPEERFDEVAGLVNALPEVAHNYRREHALNMWFVLATETVGGVAQAIAAIEELTGLTVYAFPKEREYFVEMKLQA